MRRIATKVCLEIDTVNLLDNVATRMRREIYMGHLPSRGRGKSWGAGTVAASLVEYVVREHPELLEEIGHDSERKTGND